MKLLQLEFKKNYKLFEKGTVIRFSNTKDNEDLSFSFLCGKNGSGKTTVMSIVAQLFNNIERGHSRIPADFELKYQIKYKGENNIVKLSSTNRRIMMTVEGKFDNKYLIDKQAYLQSRYKRFIDRERSRAKIVEPEIVKDYLPKNIVASVFSMHNEWPTPRPHNFLGLRLVSVFETSGIYGKNHYGLPSITKGVCRFLKSYYSHENKLGILLKFLNLEFTGRIKINVPFTQNKRWVKTNHDNFNNYVAKGLSEGIYINDIEFIRNENPVFLDNMSSGEKMLMHRILAILTSIEDDGIIFIEEPELHLDPLWKKQLISIFKTVFSEFKAHFIISTHSPSLINTVSKDQIIYLENGKEMEIDFNTLLSDEEMLISKLFSTSVKLNIVEQSILDKISSTEDVKEIEKIIQSLGDSVFKVIALNKLRLLNEARPGK